MTCDGAAEEEKFVKHRQTKIFKIKHLKANLKDEKLSKGIKID